MCVLSLSLIHEISVVGCLKGYPMLWKKGLWNQRWVNAVRVEKISPGNFGHFRLRKFAEG